MDLQELITKTEIKRDIVLELIQKAETTEECFTELAVERFLKSFLFDLKALAKKPETSDSGLTIPIVSVSLPSDKEIDTECNNRFTGNIAPTYFKLGAEWMRCFCQGK